VYSSYARASSTSARGNMNSFRLLLRSVLHHRRTHLGLVAGTALAAAILTGALVVGDSVDHTLSTFAVQRLGRAELAITSGGKLFSEGLADALRPEVKATVAPVLALPGMAIYQDTATGKRTQVNKVQALGVGTDFWDLANDAGGVELGKREAALDQRLAATLGVKVGDTVALRIAKPGLLSRDAPLSSREEDVSQRANFTVKAIVTDAQLGRFSLAPSQLPPSNFFVALADLQALAGTAEQANLLLVGDGAAKEVAEQALQTIWKPEFAGLRIESRGEHVFQLESNRIFIDAATEKAALSLPDAKGALTYLVNAIQFGEKVTPYSFITAASSLTEGLRDDEIIISDWLAANLGVGVGGQITVKYYEVLPSNKFEERTHPFTVKKILPIADLALEKALVPNFPGLSNVESCKDWKIGMPMDEELLKDEANEAYWKEHRQTPKALVNLAIGQKLWANRFGTLTGVRFEHGTASADELMAALTKNYGPRDAGLEVRAVRAEANIAATSGTDLGMLFLGMSFFLLIAAFTLTGLLYAFGAQQRAEEIGTLAALGFTRGRIRGLLLLEALLVALPGALIGAGLGLAYAWALMFGLAHYWQDAIGHIPLLFHAEAPSVFIGVLGTIACALATAAMTLRRLLRHSVNELMHADFTQAFQVGPRGIKALIAAAFLLISAGGLVVYGYISPPADPVGIFFSSGSMVLIGGLFFAWHVLSPRQNSGKAHPPTTLSLALMNATRRRGRSLGMIASLATGAFIVLAASSMQTDLSANAHKRSSGTGGFALYADATVPILDPAELSAAAPGVSALGLRVFDGDDASCLNLNHAIRPRVLGVDAQALTQLKAFVEGGDETLWEQLDRDPVDGVIPALVGDADTAMWTLKKKTDPESGDTLTYRDEAGRDASLKLVGRLPMRLSVFQGTILISAKNFTTLWPSQEGFRVFLLDAPAEVRAESIAALQTKFDRHGLDVVPSLTRLEMFHAVEGTYLSMFLVLGGVGLLLGATATGVVILRNLLERRREVALLRALGFTPQAVFRLLACEYGLLLGLAAGIGALASVVAMLPALSADHAAATTLSRFGVLALVIGSAGFCAWIALVLGLRKTGVASLRVE